MEITLKHLFTLCKEKIALWLLARARVDREFSTELRTQAYRLLGLQAGWAKRPNPEQAPVSEE